MFVFSKHKKESLVTFAPTKTAQKMCKKKCAKKKTCRYPKSRYD